MHGRGLKSRPPGSDTMKDDSSSTSPTIKLRCYNRGGGSSYAIVQHYCHTKRHSREIVGAQLVERSWVLEKVTGREIISWTVDLWNCSRRISGAQYHSLPADLYSGLLNMNMGRWESHSSTTQSLSVKNVTKRLAFPDLYLPSL
jgi:hypothetical protein